ncbi:hypothetical protein C2G38_2153634 [Gigaspora rosea]|uniref:Uncharacterized protein n=1 Tax=Gigaspora rosea TaxID=44941 RepID=A0A397W7Q7_9GLOM|nr:hypothetical protein C2G38_2153634 [Gigaspora rosea]
MFERVKESENGNVDVKVSGVIIGRDWTLAVINGYDTSIYEYNWTSYLAVKDTQTA